MVSELKNLLAVPEQVVTGQSGAPVVRLIQDAVVVAFWLSHLQPETHCPLQLSRAVFEQIAADIDVSSVFARLEQIQHRWLYEIPADHPMKRAMSAAKVDYMRTGFAILSLCLPSGCQFAGRMPASETLVSLYRRQRRLPPKSVCIDVQRGLYLGQGIFQEGGYPPPFQCNFSQNEECGSTKIHPDLGGIITADTLTGSKGLLNHIYQNHGPSEGTRFLSRIQRLTTSVSLYGYCTSVGLDDCLLPATVRATSRNIISDAVIKYHQGLATRADRPLPYHLNDENLVDVEVARLVQLRSESETFVTHHVLGQRTSQQHRASAASPLRFNQVALLAMLGTKGSVPCVGLKQGQCRRQAI